MEPIDESNTWAKAAVVFLGIVLPLVAGGVGTFVVTFRGDIQARFDQISRRFDRIEARVDEFTTGTNHPLSWAEAREMERRIDALELCCAKQAEHNAHKP